MDVFEDVRYYYEEQIDWEPDVKRKWVESYLRDIQEKEKSEEELADIWEDIFAFIFYQDRSEHSNLSEMQYWEYSVCLEWLESHMLSGTAYNLNLKNAKRFLGRLLDFYKFLVSKDCIENYQELEKAYNKICCRKKLNLVKRIPYTGKEMWTSIFPPGKEGETFRMWDCWIIVLYVEFNNSWAKLTEKAHKIPSANKKLGLIENLQKKLKNIGYDDPKELFHRGVSNDDIDDAKKWFYEKQI